MTVYIRSSVSSDSCMAREWSAAAAAFGHANRDFVSRLDDFAGFVENAEGGEGGVGCAVGEAQVGDELGFGACAKRKAKAKRSVSAAEQCGERATTTARGVRCGCKG